jgi:hypothetical protein
MKALLDSGAAITLISPKVVERLGIEYQTKKHPIAMVLADDSTIPYGKGMINLETKEVEIEVAGFRESRNIDIMPLGGIDVFIGYDWLRKHNPIIDWRTGQITKRQTHDEIAAKTSREPSRQVAGRRRGSGSRESPLDSKTQSSPERGYAKNHNKRKFVKISRCKIARIARKTPEAIGVIHIRQVREEPRIGQETAKMEFRLPAEYSEYKMLFEDQPEGDLPERRSWDHEIPIVEGAKLTPGPLFPTTRAQEEELKKFLGKFIPKGYIRKSQSPMASSVLFVPKKDGKMRFCVDYRRLNENTVKNRYPLPLISEIMDRLQGTKWFTKFDVRDGFHRIRIAEGHEWKTAFRTKYGLYEWCVMPMGLTNAPATFQAVVNEVLNEYLDVFVLVYLDDILVYTNGTKEEHIEHVRKVLKKLQEHKLLLKPEKCEFHVTETDYLGYTISRNGVGMNPAKVQAVLDWPVPTKVKEVQSFLGLANYYRKFIQNYSGIAAPLTEVTKKDVGFQWGAEQQEAFEMLKKWFTEAPMLRMYDPNQPTRVETDASDKALGAVLAQECEDKQWRPVFYHSRKFDKHEVNYDVHDKELLAIVDALKQWEVQLKGAQHPFKVLSDHQNLSRFMTTKKLIGRQIRWAEMLADYDFTIQHRAGTLNGAADALSRRSDLTDQIKSLEHDPIFAQRPDGALEFNHARTCQIRVVSDTLEDQWVNRLTLQVYEQNQTTDEETLWRHSQLVNKRPRVEGQQLEQLIQELHQSKGYGHPGASEMIRRIKLRFFAVGLQEAVKKVVSKCLECSKNKPLRHKPYGLLQPLPPPEGPWTSVTMDFITKLPKSREPGSGRICDSILTIVDRSTKWTYGVPTTESITAEELAYEVSKTLTVSHGMPKEFVTDRDKLFTSAFWKTLMAKLGTRVKLSSSYHPETDGQSERMNQRLEEYLRMYANTLQDNWVELLPTAQLALNSARSSTTGYSPFYANYGYEPSGPRDPYEIDDISQTARKKARRLKAVHEQLSRNIAQRNLQTAVQANKRRIEGPILKEGGKVFLSTKHLKTKRPCRKLDNRRIGPFKILEKRGPVNFKLQLPKGMRIHPVFHISKLEPAPDDAELATDIELEFDEYEVEEIQGLQKKGRQWKYYIKWRGWPTSSNTWEPLSSLTNCKELVNAYHQRNPKAGEKNHGERHQGQTKKKKRHSHRSVTSPGQRRTVRIAMVQKERWHPYSQYSSRIQRNSTLSPAYPSQQRTALPDGREPVLVFRLRPASLPGEEGLAPPQRDDEQHRLLRGPTPGGLRAVHQPPCRTLERKASSCTTRQPGRNQHNDQRYETKGRRRSPYDNDDTDPQPGDPDCEHAQPDRGCELSKSDPWAWLGPRTKVKDRATESHRWADSLPFKQQESGAGDGSPQAYQDIGTIHLKEGGSVTHKEDTRVSPKPSRTTRRDREA